MLRGADRIGGKSVIGQAAAEVARVGDERQTPKLADEFDVRIVQRFVGHAAPQRQNPQINRGQHAVQRQTNPQTATVGEARRARGGSGGKNSVLQNSWKNAPEIFSSPARLFASLSFYLKTKRALRLCEKCA